MFLQHTATNQQIKPVNNGAPKLTTPESKEAIERFSFECRKPKPKTKTKVITLAYQKEHRQYSEPIKTRSNYM